jgi:hypothetical protein
VAGCVGLANSVTSLRVIQRATDCSPIAVQGGRLSERFSNTSMDVEFASLHQQQYREWVWVVGTRMDTKAGTLKPAAGVCGVNVSVQQSRITSLRFDVFAQVAFVDVEEPNRCRCGLSQALNWLHAVLQISSSRLNSTIYCVCELRWLTSCRCVTDASRPK